MRALILAALILAAASTAAPATARADVGIGIFLIQPTGLDIKLGLDARSGLDIVLGVADIDSDVSYGHITYLVTPFVGRGSSAIVPFRIGIGGAIFGLLEDNAGVALRVPLELGVRFRSVPFEIYGEVAFRVVFFNSNADFDLDGGVGLRSYF